MLNISWRVIHEKPIKFLDKHKVLCKSQSGFTKNYSPDFYLSYLIDKISNHVDSGLPNGMVLIELQKAFDTIDHNILIQKIPSLGYANE